jgi:hypothetical protein
MFLNVVSKFKGSESRGKMVVVGANARKVRQDRTCKYHLTDATSVSIKENIPAIVYAGGDKTPFARRHSIA